VHARLLTRGCPCPPGACAAGVGWNKGGVAVSLQLGYTDVCIINSHLAAHQGKLKERNENYTEIAGAPAAGCECGCVGFWVVGVGVWVGWGWGWRGPLPAQRRASVGPAAEHLRGHVGQDALLGHHHVLWMGDLNYRLDWGQQVGRLRALCPALLCRQRSLASSRACMPACHAGQQRPRATTPAAVGRLGNHLPCCRPSVAAGHHL
jgi:hypothetical protein